MNNSLYVVEGLYKSTSETSKPNKEGVGSFRRILSQVLACFLIQLLIVNHSVTYSWESTISHKASWWLDPALIVIILLTCIPFGLASEIFGRKSIIFFANTSSIVIWFCLAQVESLSKHGVSSNICDALFDVAHGLLRLSMALTWASVIAYIKEISEASTRIVLLSSIGLAWSSGDIIFHLYAEHIGISSYYLPWLIQIPPIAMTLMHFVPESPIWLLSKVKDDVAFESHKWLRGWRATSIMAAKFQHMQRSRDRLLSCRICRAWELRCYHTPPSVGEKLHDILKKKWLKPMLCIAILFLIAELYSTKTEGPNKNFEQIKYEFGISILFLAFVWTLGLRMVALWAYFGITISQFIITYYHDDFIPNSNPFELSVPFKFQYYLVLHTIKYVPVVWTADLLPFKSRSFTTIILLAFSQILSLAHSAANAQLAEMKSFIRGGPFGGCILGLNGFLLILFLMRTENNQSGVTGESRQQYQNNSADVQVLIER